MLWIQWVKLLWQLPSKGPVCPPSQLWTTVWGYTSVRTWLQQSHCHGKTSIQKNPFHVPASVMEHSSPGCFWHTVKYLHRLLWVPDRLSEPWWVHEQLGLYKMLAILKIKLSLQTTTCYSPSSSLVHFKTEKYLWIGKTAGSKPYKGEDVILSFSHSKGRRKARVQPPGTYRGVSKI